MYTDNRADSRILKPCMEQLKKAFTGEIVSVSLKPIDLGKNIVLEAQRSYPTMLKQIVVALETLTTDIVFFCEHDVLYSPTHFDFTPERDDIYYYNINNWRWDIREDFAITYDGLHSLSALCCNRKLALNHFTNRLNYVEAKGWDKVRSREPRWGRVMGYEPGTKSRRRGGFTDEEHIVWKSAVPNIDVRHKHTFSAPKIKLSDFKNPPKNWRQEPIENIKEWNLREIFV